MYDIVFISYKEPNAEFNWKALDDRFQGRTRRLHGVKGIHRAHWVASSMVTTEMFYVVDGDAEILPEFHFNHQVPNDQKDHVFVFRAKNPVNDLIYGYGAVKLIPTASVMKMDLDNIKPDMTSSLPDSKYHVVHELSNITRFNTDPFNSWRSAFRECAKLSSKVIDNQKDKETEQRLEAWCSLGTDRPNGLWTIKGAKAGSAYGRANRGDLSAIAAINDMQWMLKKFDEVRA